MVILSMPLVTRFRMVYRWTPGRSLIDAFLRRPSRIVRDCLSYPTPRPRRMICPSYLFIRNYRSLCTFAMHTLYILLFIREEEYELETDVVSRVI